MSIALVNVGAFVTGLNSTITPVAGGAYLVGDALLYSTGECFGGDDIATPGGWTLLSLNTLTTQMKVFGKVAASTSETIPGVNWSAANRSWAQLTIFRGVDPGFTSAVAGGTNTERGANVTANITGPAGSITPNTSGALVWWSGARNKTTTTDSTVYTADAAFTMATQLVQAGSGTRPSVALQYVIQTTATAISANAAAAGSIAEGVAQAMRSTVVYLAPAPPPSGGGGSGTTLFPPPRRKTYVYINNYYPR